MKDLSLPTVATSRLFLKSSSLLGSAISAESPRLKVLEIGEAGKYLGAASCDQFIMSPIELPLVAR